MRRRRPLGLVLELVKTVLLTVGLYLAIQAFVAQPYRVEQGSMQDTLQEGQYILIDKLTPQVGGYGRGDIVVFRPPPSAGEPDDTPFIKRVIGIGGDVVEIADGRVSVNGEPLAESYVFRGQGTYPYDVRRTRWTVPEGSLFVLGDHRSDSADSRTARIGFIPERDVVGRAFLRYWPIPSLGLLETPSYEPPDAALAPAAGLP